MFVTDPESAAVPITYWPLLSDIIIGTGLTRMTVLQ